MPADNKATAKEYHKQPASDHGDAKIQFQTQKGSDERAGDDKCTTKNKEFRKRSADGVGRRAGAASGRRDTAASPQNRDFQNPGLDSTDLSEIEALQKNFCAMSVSAASPDISTSDIAKYKNTKWETLKVSRKIAAELEEAGFAFPSPVQALSIPPAIEGRDLLVRAKNGTGKSASFIIPILNKIDTSKMLQAVILVPIRELALQVSKIFMTLGKSLGIKCVPLVGGTDVAADIMRLNAGVHVIIGTPGRICDLLGKKLCKIEDSPIIVFDEADKLLDSHFYGSLNELLHLFPRNRQMLLYSATFPQSIEGFVKSNMNNPLKIKVSDQNLANVKQYYVKIKNHTKLLCLKSLLMTLDIDQCIIYCNSIRNVENLAEKITSLGMSAYFINSEMGQVERCIVYHNFSKKKCRILVSTDVTTRGIDVPGVNVVINFDMPISSESYLHRIGRTGRFGTRGCAINFINENEALLIQTYEQALGVDVYLISDPSFRDFCK